MIALFGTCPAPADRRDEKRNPSGSVQGCSSSGGFYFGEVGVMSTSLPRDEFICFSTNSSHPFCTPVVAIVTPAVFRCRAQLDSSPSPSTGGAGITRWRLVGGRTPVFTAGPPPSRADARSKRGCDRIRWIGFAG